MTYQEYYVSLCENDTTGPLTHEQVQALLIEGKISELTWTWTESSVDWRPFSYFSEFDSGDLEEVPEEPEPASDPPPVVERQPEPQPVFVQGPPMAQRPVIEIGRGKGNPDEPLPEDSQPPWEMGWERSQPPQPEDRATAEDQPEAEEYMAIEPGLEMAQSPVDEDSIELPPEAADEPPPQILSTLIDALEHDDDCAPVGGTGERSEDTESPAKGEVRFITAEFEALGEQDTFGAECSSCGTKVTRCPCCGEILVMAPVASRRSA